MAQLVTATQQTDIRPVCNVTFKGDMKVASTHMSVRQLSMNGSVGNSYSSGGSRRGLFQIATGFADIPRIVRIFPELCRQYWAELFCGTLPQYCRRLILQNSTPFLSPVAFRGQS